MRTNETDLVQDDLFADINEVTAFIIVEVLIVHMMWQSLRCRLQADGWKREKLERPLRLC